MFFSLIVFFISIKAEAVIEDYISKNEKIIKKLELKLYTGLRVKIGAWRIIRFKYILPTFYGLVSVALITWLILILL